MKFLSKEDIFQFQAEIDELDASQSLDETYVPTEESKIKFYKKRGTILNPIKNFRRSQDAKRSWRLGKRKRIKAIKDYHNSTSGKQNSKKLAHFNATRIINPKNETFNKYEILKCLSSISTHLFIMMEYYHPLHEEVELILFLEDLIPEIRRVEDRLMNEESLQEEDLDLLLHFSTDEDLIQNLAKISGKDSELCHKINEYYMKEHFPNCSSLYEYYTFLVEKINLGY